MLLRSIESIREYLSVNFDTTMKRCIFNCNNNVDLFIVTDDNKIIFHNNQTKTIYVYSQLNNLLVKCSTPLGTNEKQYRIYFNGELILYFTEIDSKLDIPYVRYKICDDNLIKLSLKSRRFMRIDILKCTLSSEPNLEKNTENICKNLIDFLKSINLNNTEKFVLKNLFSHTTSTSSLF